MNPRKEQDVMAARETFMSHGVSRSEPSGTGEEGNRSRSMISTR